MKKLFFLVLSLVLISCNSDSVSDEFNDANDDNNNNGSVASKLITTITGEDASNPTQSESIFVSYDANNRVSSVSDGTEASVLVYDNGSLSTVTSTGGSPFNIEELYQSPYDAFETGEVLEYDNNGNPTLISFFEEEYDINTDSYTIEEYTADIYYENKPNPYFYTLQAAGIIEVLDNVDLNFSSDSQNPDLIQARALFPVNNIKRIVYKDVNHVVLHEFSADYVYNSVDHPITATVTNISTTDNTTYVYTLAYTYLE